MDAPKPLFRRILGFAAPLAVGVVVFVLMQRARTDPTRAPVEERGHVVRTAVVQELEATPTARGYGVVRSSREWSLVAEVSGRVIELHDDLEEGRIIEEGTKLIKIDPRGFELSASQQKAIVANAKAQLSELKTREKNTRASLAIAERSLALAKKELERVQALERSGAASASEVDNAEAKYLGEQQNVQNYENTLAEIPADRRGLNAQIDQYEAGLGTAELDVSRTEISAPFDVRISAVDVELSELVTVGAVLATGDGIALAEVPAQFSIGSLQPLFPPQPTVETSVAESISPRALARIPGAAGLRARVLLESGALRATWDAKFDRFGNVDSDTRTVSVVVSVDEPYERTGPGRRPPLVSGMYVEVQLRGVPRPQCRAVPRAALRGDKLHVVGEGDRLEIREVDVEFVQDDYACVADGVEAGDAVVLTELSPAIEGMLLEPRRDEATEAVVRVAVRPHGGEPGATER